MCSADMTRNLERVWTSGRTIINLTIEKRLIFSDLSKFIDMDAKSINAIQLYS